MIHLDLSKRKELTPQGTAGYRVVFNIFERKFEVFGDNRWQLREDVYDWLIDNVSKEANTYRKWDRLFYDNPTHKLPSPDKLRKHEDWEKWNPPLESKESYWLWERDKLYFTDNKWATLFKLHWF